MASAFPPETYTPLESQRIDDLRSKLVDLDLSEDLLDPANLIRWLRARNLNVSKAQKMFRQNLEWRRENQVDGILEREQIPDDIKITCPTGYIGLDREGYPIFLLPTGRRNIHELLETWGPERFLRISIIYGEMLMDVLQKVSKEQGRQVTQTVQIIDLEGFNYRQLLSKLVLDARGQAQAYNDNYPEMVRYIMVINAPKAFYMIWNVLKSVLPKETLGKVSIFGTDKEQWRAAIRERIPVEGMPPYWGGCRPGEDEYCSEDEKLWIQGALTANFFDFDKPLLLNNDENADELPLTSVTIGPRNSLKIKLSVKTPPISSKISWRFRTESHDIGFQIVEEGESGNGIDLVPYKRISHIQGKKQFVEGSVTCQKAGVYTVIFDNSYSWTRVKTVQYSLSVIDG